MGKNQEDSGCGPAGPAPLGANPSREWNSEAYHRLSAPQLSWGRRVLERLRLNGDETLIDAGCGTGKLTAELLERLPRGRVLALDLSQNMLRLAREHLQPRFPRRVLFARADLSNMPFCEAVDGIFSTATFHWIRDHEQLFRSLFCALRPGGWLEAQCGGGPNLRCLLERARALVAVAPFDQFFLGWQSPWEYAYPETAAERLARAGFSNIHTSLEHAPVALENADRYREYICMVIFHRHLEQISNPQIRDTFLDDLTRQAANDRPPFVADYWRLNVSARRPG